MTQYDLGALVIHLRALVNFHSARHMGRAVQQFGLSQLACVDSDLAQRIHDSVDMKPFTVSGLMRGDDVVREQCQPGESVWVRLNGLSADVVAALEERRSALNGQLAIGRPVIVEIDRQPWQVLSASWNGTDWSARTSYQALIERHRFVRPATRLGLNFITATTFRSVGMNIPLPIPAQVFGSLLSRWQAFTSHRLRDLPADQVDAYLKYCIRLSRHDIQTVLVHGKQGSRHVGFTGRAMFELARNSPHLESVDPELAALLEREHIWMARLANLLADFALYSGVGRKTTTGMGMARCDWTRS